MAAENLDPDLIEILACPMCKGDIEFDGDELTCSECGRNYPIEDGIPNMLPDELRE